jgi:hypothetical protein
MEIKHNNLRVFGPDQAKAASRAAKAAAANGDHFSQLPDGGWLHLPGHKSVVEVDQQSPILSTEVEGKDGVCFEAAASFAVFSVFFLIMKELEKKLQTALFVVFKAAFFSAAVLGGAWLITSLAALAAMTFKLV